MSDTYAKSIIDEDIASAYDWCKLSKVLEMPGTGDGWRHTCYRLAKELERMRSSNKDLTESLGSVLDGLGALGGKWYELNGHGIEEEEAKKIIDIYNKNKDVTN